MPLRERAATHAADRPKALAPNTVELYRKQLDRLLLPAFGAVPVSPPEATSHVFIGTLGAPLGQVPL